MKIKIVVRQGRGKRWRFFLVNAEDKDVGPTGAGGAMAMSTGSFRSYEEAIEQAEQIMQADFQIGDTYVESPSWWKRWLSGR